MYKILFVDDDPLIIKKLYQILDWEALGFVPIGSASDGESAMQLVRTEMPDVIISDINMPNMDGLAFASEVKALSANLQFILLTVNDSFGCAQQALNIGVCHYLLKPIEKSKLEALIKKVHTDLEQSHQQTLYVTKLQEKATLSERAIKEKFLNWVASGRQVLNEKQLQERFQFYNIHVTGKVFQILSIHINQLDQFLNSETDCNALLNTVNDCLENTLCDYRNYTVFSDSFYNMNILLGFEDMMSPDIQRTPAICQNLRNDLLFTLNLPVTISYSRIHQGYQNIYRCYFETKYLSRYNREAFNKGIFSYDSLLETAQFQHIDFDSMRLEILKHLRAGDLDKLTQFVRRSFLANAEKNNDYTYFHILRIDFIMTGILFIQENKLNMREIFNHHFEPLSEVIEKNDVSECMDFICNFYQTLLGYVSRNAISSGHSLTEKCMELVTENLGNPALSVKWLASQLYIHENYLSKQFHKEARTTLAKYISNQRLDAAKEYLDSGYTNQQAVAEMCGFHDPLYFSKCFKKRFGVAPSKYAENRG